MKKPNFYILFYIFLFGSIFGWIIEVIFSYIKRGIFLNHSGLVIGPFNLIYGIGACILTIILFKYKESSSIKIFFISFFAGTILEYIASIGMELLVGFTAWNYSKYFLNINGRVCLLYSIYWGIIGIIWIKLCYPFLEKLINKFNYSLGKKVMIFLILFLSLDCVLTISAVNRAHDKDLGIEAKNKYEEFLDDNFSSDYLKNMYNNHWQ